MTNDRILKAAIEKAEKNGWDDSIIGCETMFGEAHDTWWEANNHYFMFIFSHDFARAFFGEEEIIDMNKIRHCVLPKIKTSGRKWEGDIIFKTDDPNSEKSIKKILDSTKNISVIDSEKTIPKELCIMSWQYHLQEMVISEDPIKYLEPFLK